MPMCAHVCTHGHKLCVTAFSVTEALPEDFSKEAD